MNQRTERSFVEYVRSHVQRALEEDIRGGDLTTWATVNRGTKGRMKIIAREGGVAGGVICAITAFQLIDPGINVNVLIDDGKEFSAGDIIMEIEGNVRAMLMAERTALNYLQHLSGVATLTNKFVKAVEGTKAKITDTRKTLPLWRRLQKWAVTLGGGVNHRFSLNDAVLIKENHITAAGGIAEAVYRIKEYLTRIGRKVPVIVEVETMEQLKSLEPLFDFITRVMLDNFRAIEDIKNAVDFVAGRVEVEVSGGVSLDNVRDIALTGVDYISIGSLTHSVKAIDLSALLKM